VIGSVRGTVVERDVSGEVLVEVGGVGYRVLVPLSAIATLDPGGRAFLFTHLHVRDDAMTLYGFPTREERETFEVLLAAAGVGPTLALKILSVLTPGTLARAVADEDLEALTQVPGVGKRTAERLMVELRARLELPETRAAPGAAADAAARVEVREALTALGYAPDEIRAVLGALPDDGTVQELLRTALRQLART
jgi:Holliday junction DNA helicase RuvA